MSAERVEVRMTEFRRKCERENERKTVVQLPVLEKEKQQQPENDAESLSYPQQTLSIILNSQVRKTPNESCQGGMIGQRPQCFQWRVGRTNDRPPAMRPLFD